MVVSDTLQKAINDKDIATIRSSFYTIILSDPYFRTNKFDETLKYVQKQQIEGLFDADIGAELKDKSEWNEEYFDLLASQLQDNFSIARINQLKQVAEYLASHEEKSKLVHEKVAFEKTDNTQTKDETKRATYTKPTIEKDKSNVVAYVAIAIAGIWVLRKLFKGGK